MNQLIIQTCPRYRKDIKKQFNPETFGRNKMFLNNRKKSAIDKVYKKTFISVQLFFSPCTNISGVYIILYIRRKNNASQNSFIANIHFNTMMI